MERYEVCEINPLQCIELKLRNYHDPKRMKSFYIHKEDLLSILYIDNLNEVGERKEYQIDGRVLEIKYHSDMYMTQAAYIRDMPNCIASNLNLTPSTMNIARAEIIVDCGNKRDAKVLTLNAYNILDIERYPHKFDLCENPKLIPEMVDGIVVNEMKTPQQIDVGIPPWNPWGEIQKEILGGDNNE